MSAKALTSRSRHFLLATATIFLLQHAGATSSSNLVDVVCTPETEACLNNNSECEECLTVEMDRTDEYLECLDSYSIDYESFSSAAYIDEMDLCAYWTAHACCLDLVSANDCLGNSAFVGAFACLFTYIDECSALTCSDGSGGVGVVDDDATGTDIASSTNDGAVGNDDTTETDDGAVVGSDEATATDNSAVGNDDTTEADDGAVGSDDATATGDGAVDSDDDADSSLNTGGTSGVGSSLPSTMLTHALVFLSAAPLLYVLQL